IAKELTDNALDACEEAGIAPKITITVDKTGITAADNGPGIPAKTVNSLLDFSVRVRAGRGPRQARPCPCPTRQPLRRKPVQQAQGRGGARGDAGGHQAGEGEAPRTDR